MFDDPKLRRKALKHWLENEFVAAVKDDKKVGEAAGVLKVAIDQGEDSIEALRKCIAYFVVDLIDRESLVAIAAERGETLP